MSLIPPPYTEGYAGYLAHAWTIPCEPLNLELLKSLDDLDEEEDEDAKTKRMTTISKTWMTRMKTI